MPATLRLLSALVGFCSPLSGIAAEVWLRPDRFSATPGATVGAEVVAVGESTQPFSSAVREAHVTLAGSAVPVGLEPWKESQRAQRISATFTRPGWAIWSVDLAPSVESLSGPEVISRLHVLYAPSGVHERVLAHGLGARWRVSSHATVKCIVKVGEPESDDRSWRDANRSGWDLVPSSELSGLRVGKAARFTLLAGALPATGVVVALRSIGGEQEYASLADAAGSVEFTVSDSGLWLASASHVQISPADESLLEVRSVSFVFSVR